MEIGFLVAPYANQPLPDVLSLLRKRFGDKLKAIEVGVSEYGQLKHAVPSELLKSSSAIQDWEGAIVNEGFRLSAFAGHGNPIHPIPQRAEMAEKRLLDAIKLMARLDACLMRDSEGVPIRVVNCFSGLPSGALQEKDGTFIQQGSVPGWQSCPWPDEHYDSYILQMRLAGKKWKEIVKVAKDLKVQLALELHPNMLAHNPETYLMLLEETGDDGSTLGLNLDPSHFFWRLMDPIAVVRYLNKTLSTRPIKHCHGKDAFLDPYNAAINGNQSATPYSKEADRVWRFVAIGDGWDPLNGEHGLNWWKRFVSELQLWGYDHVISIEHEDSRKSFEEGLAKALSILDQAVNRDKPGPMTWAER
jgi:DNA-(apurinic or apyrimidinic site) lyase